MLLGIHKFPAPGRSDKHDNGGIEKCRGEEQVSGGVGVGAQNGNSPWIC